MSLFDDQPRPDTGRWLPPDALPELAGVRRLALDCETTGKRKHHDRPVGIAYRTDDGRQGYLPFAHRGGGNLDEAQVRRWAQHELRDKDIVNLNIGFDFEVLRHWGADLEAQGNRLHEIAHPAALLNEYRFSGFSLESLGREYVQEGKKTCPVSPGEIQFAHASEIGPYAEQDAALALKIDAAYQQKIDIEGLRDVLELEDRLIYVTSEMERHGARLDLPKLHRWRAEVRDQHEKILLELGHRFNPESSKDLARLFDQHRWPCGISKETGQPAYTNEVLARISDPLAQKVLRARRLNSLRTKYLDKYAAAVEGEILRFSLYQLRGDDYGTVTGRYSSANVNIQQVLKVEKQVAKFGPDFIIRELFVPDAGYDYLSADAAQIEFRLFAHYSADPELVAAYEKDPEVDFHNLTLAMIRRMNPSATRMMAKVGNFLCIYGGGPQAAEEQLQLEEGAGQTFFDDYHAAFPAARRLINQASHLAQQRGWVKTLLGRRGRFPKKDGYHKALNKVIQGSAADLNKLKLLEVYRQRRELGVHKLRMTVHDEIVADLHPDPENARKFKQFLDQQSLPLRVPILWDARVGRDWKECA